MGNVKLVVAALTALALGTGSAYAIEVSKKINAPAVPPKVRAIAGTSAPSRTGTRWSPIARRPRRGAPTFRTLTLKNGGTIKEKLLSSTIPATATRSSRARCR